MSSEWLSGEAGREGSLLLNDGISMGDYEPVKA